MIFILRTKYRIINTGNENFLNILQLITNFDLPFFLLKNINNFDMIQLRLGQILVALGLGPHRFVLKVSLRPQNKHQARLYRVYKILQVERLFLRLQIPWGLDPRLSHFKSRLALIPFVKFTQALMDLFSRCPYTKKCILSIKVQITFISIRLLIPK